jgi:hypothetical protein
MDSLTFASGVVEPVHDATSDDSSAATFVSATGTADNAGEPSEQQVSFATSAFDPYNSIFSAQVSSLGGDDEFGSTNVFSQARTTLAYSSQDNASGTTLTTSDSSDTANVALFGQYMASSVAPWSAGNVGGMATNETLLIASNTASGTGANGDVANPAPTDVSNGNNSSAPPVMLSAMAEQAPPEITAGLMMAYSMSDSAFAVATATAMPDPAPSSGGTAFAVITSTTSNSVPPASGGGFVAVAGDLAATNGSTAGSVTTPGTGTINGLTDLTVSAAPASTNTWQQDVALMSNYLASTFPMPAVGNGSASSAVSSAPPTQDALSAASLANHQNSV